MNVNDIRVLVTGYPHFLSLPLTHSLLLLQLPPLAMARIYAAHYTILTYVQAHVTTYVCVCVKACVHRCMDMCVVAGLFVCVRVWRVVSVVYAWHCLHCGQIRNPAAPSNWRLQYSDFIPYSFGYFQLCIHTLTFMWLFLFMVIFTLIFAVIKICIYTFSLLVLLGIWMRLSIYPPHTAPPLAPLGVHAGVIRCSDKLHYLAGLCEMRALY